MARLAKGVRYQPIIIVVFIVSTKSYVYIFFEILAHDASKKIRLDPKQLKLSFFGGKNRQADEHHTKAVGIAVINTGSSILLVSDCLELYSRP